MRKLTGIENGNTFDERYGIRRCQMNNHGFQWHTGWSRTFPLEGARKWRRYWKEESWWPRWQVRGGACFEKTCFCKREEGRPALRVKVQAVDLLYVPHINSNSTRHSRPAPAPTGGVKIELNAIARLKLTAPGARDQTQSERTLGKAKHGEAQPFDQCKMMICHHPNSI